jgi:hypothetical protein
MHPRGKSMEVNPYESSTTANPTFSSIATDNKCWTPTRIAMAIVAGVLVLVPLISFPALVILGWICSAATTRTAHTLARVTPIAIAIGIVVLLFSGPFTNADDFHRWAGHGLVIVTWLATPFALGVLAEEKLVHRPLVAIMQSLVLLLYLSLTLFASFTAYLGEIRNPDITDQTTHRLFVLHCILLPSLLLLLLPIWFFSFRRRPLRLRASA